MPLVFKIVDRHAWQRAEALGSFDGAPVDLRDGYIHLSAAHQVRETAAKHFRGQDDLLLVAYTSEVLGKDLRWEASRGGDLFPHLYGSLPTAKALWAKPLRLDADREHLFPDLS